MNRCTSGSSIGSIPRSIRSWNEPTRIGTIVKSRRPPRRYWRNTTWNSIECSVRWVSSSSKRSLPASAARPSTYDRSVGTTPSGVSKSLYVSANRRRQYWWATPRITNVSACGLLHQLAVGPGVDRAAAMEIDVRAEDAAEPVARPDAVDRRRAGAVVADEQLLELRAEGPERGGVGPARHRRGATSRLAVLLVEHREGRAVDDHRLIEAPDQILQLLHRHELPRLPEHPGLDLHQRRLAIEMADDLDIAIERDQDRLGDHPGRILQHHEGLTLMLDPSSGERPEFRPFQRWLNASGRHRLAHRPPPTAQRVQGPRHVGAEYPHHHVTRGHVASSTAARTPRLAGDQRQRPRRRSDLADGLRLDHRLLLLGQFRRRHRPADRFIASSPEVPKFLHSQTPYHQRRAIQGCLRMIAARCSCFGESRPNRSPEFANPSGSSSLSLDLTASRG